MPVEGPQLGLVRLSRGLYRSPNTSVSGPFGGPVGLPKVSEGLLGVLKVSPETPWGPPKASDEALWGPHGPSRGLCPFLLPPRVDCWV